MVQRLSVRITKLPRNGKGRLEDLCRFLGKCAWRAVGGAA